MAAKKTLVEAADDVADALNADVYLFSSPIFHLNTDTLIGAIAEREAKRDNAALVLTTTGGSADSAFQLARCLQRNYKKLTLFVFGDCKSAGTLVAIAANEIVMSDFGQFGPLDVQLADKEELLGQMPALEVSQTLTTLSQTAFTFFTDHFFGMGPGRGISTKTAVEIALSLSSAIIGPIASQIDPLLLGRVERSMKVAQAYSQRLNKGFENINKLTNEYPSHEFVIDSEEAHGIFNNVRKPSPAESVFEECLRATKAVPHELNCVCALSSPLPLSPPPSPTPPPNSPHVSPPEQQPPPITNGSGSPAPAVQSAAASDGKKLSAKQPAGRTSAPAASEQKSRS